MSDRPYFSESSSSLGNWTVSDCASLDERCYPAEEPHQPSGVDVLLLSTVPAAGVQLARNLLQFQRFAVQGEDSDDMPKRIREQILEVTKTVTVTEIVKNAPDKHPRACEVTITNLASDTSHPVSVKITHLHERHGVEQSETGTQTPDVTIDEQTSDAIRRAPEGTTRVEQEQQSTVERIIPRKQIPVTATFNLETDNVIDLQFTQPVLIETTGRQQQPRTAATTLRKGPVHTLYYQAFSHSDGLLDVVGCAHPPAVYRSSVLDEADLGSMASDASSEGSLIVYADERPCGRASSAEGYFTIIPESPSKAGRLEKSESDGVVVTGWAEERLANKDRRQYIVTSKEESREFDRAPTIRWIYAEFDPSFRSRSDSSTNPRVSRCQMNGETGSAEVLVHSRTDDEQTPGTSKPLSNGHAVFNRISCSEPKGFGTAPPKPVRTTVILSGDASESNSFLANDAFTESSPGITSDSDGAVSNRRRSTPPLMTSTPYTTLERKDRLLMDMVSDGREMRQSFSPMISNTSSVSPRKKTNEDEELSPPLPGRVSSSPIIVVNQSRTSSVDTTEGGERERRQRKHTVTDIDWFAAFNMKEPSPPKSPGVNDLDVMKEAEVAGEHSHPQGGGSRNSLEQTSKPSDINIDEVFCKKGKSSSKECTCSACNLTKLSDEERARLTRTSSRPIRHVQQATPRRALSSSNSTPAVDISLDDVFNPIRTSPIRVIKRYGVENDEGEKSSSTEGKKEDGASRSPHSVHFELEPRNATEIDLDEVFPIKKDEQKSPRNEIRKTESPPKPSRTFTANEEVRAASEPHHHKKDSLDWVAALVSTGSKSQKKNSVKETNKAEPARKEICAKVNGNGPHADSRPTAPTVRESAPAKKTSTSEHKGLKEWLYSLVRSESHKEQKTKKTTAQANKHQAEVKKNVGSAPDLSDDLMHKVFDGEGSSRSDPKRCGCAACANGSPTPVPSERKRRSAKKEERLRQEIRPSSLPPPVTTSAPTENKGPKATEAKRSTSGEPGEPASTSSKPDANPVSQQEPVDPEVIHYPPGRTLLVGDVLRKPSVLEETSFNTDHLSPISYVSKAYSQRLTQLKSELGLDEMDAKPEESSTPARDESEPLRDESEPSRDESEPSRATFYQPEADEEAPRHKAMSELVDEVFSQVFEGESSEMTSLAAASSSQTLHAQDRTEKTTDGAEPEPKRSSGFDDWYENPTSPPSEESEVKEYVDEILSQSMDEAMFSASKSLRGKEDTKEEFLTHTDTSVDRKLREQLEPALSRPGPAPEEEDELYTTTIGQEQYLEQVISYPASVASSRVTSSVTTPGPNRTRDDSEVFFAADTPSEPAPDADVFVSSASVLMNDTHSSSEGDFDEDYIIKLVFSEKSEEAKPREILADTQVERVERTVKSFEEASETANSTINSEVDNRSLSPMENDIGKADEELLEIEVFPGYFHIKGSYSLVISKGDPLGELLSEVHSKGSASSMDFSITPKLRRLLVQCFKEKSRPTIYEGDLISSRARNLLSDEDVSDIVYTLMKKNRYNAETNPEGNINFCTAENTLCSEELLTQLKNKGFCPVESHLVHYPPAGGHASTKNAVTKYVAEFMSAEVREEELVILPSSTSAYDMLCHCTCEADDIVLTSAPTYAASVRNCRCRAECRIRPVEINMESPQLDVDAYQRALDDYSARGGVVRAVLIINPHNPLGAVFPPDDVVKLCDWATKNNLVVLIDESFSSCVFTPDSSFKSLLSYRSRLENPENIMYLWSLSKDFGIPGLKISIVHSSCPKLIQSLSTLELIHPVSALAHDAATALLTDFEWLRNFHSTKLARLSAHYKFVAEQLRQMELPFCPAVGGCFVMIDFRKHLRSQTFADELSLFQSLCDKGIMLTPGQHVLCQQPGWMRLVFSCAKNELIEGICRMRLFLNMSAERESMNIEY